MLIRIRSDLEKFMGDDDEIELKDFLEFTRDHSLLLYPAFQLQLALQLKVVGLSFWEKCANRRIMLGKRNYMTVSELIKLVSLETVSQLILHGYPAYLFTFYYFF